MLSNQKSISIFISNTETNQPLKKKLAFPTACFGLVLCAMCYVLCPYLFSSRLRLLVWYWWVQLVSPFLSNEMSASFHSVWFPTSIFPFTISWYFLFMISTKEGRSIVSLISPESHNNQKTGSNANTIANTIANTRLENKNGNTKTINVNNNADHRINKNISSVFSRKALHSHCAWICDWMRERLLYNLELVDDIAIEVGIQSLSNQKSISIFISNTETIQQLKKSWLFPQPVFCLEVLWINLTG